MQQQIDFLDSLCGKMSPEHSVQMVEGTSTQSSKRSANSANPELMYLDLRTGAGNLLGAYWETGTALPGGCMTPKGGEFRNGGAESTLSQILIANAPEKYSLSRKACLGILRRAEKRGKELPDMLREALMEVVLSGGADGIDDEEDDSEEDIIEEESEEYEDE